jgi:hypothetical protein
VCFESCLFFPTRSTLSANLPTAHQPRIILHPSTHLLICPSTHPLPSHESRVTSHEPPPRPPRHPPHIILHSRFPILQTTTKPYLALYSMPEAQPLFDQEKAFSFRYLAFGFPPRATSYGSRRPPLARRATPRTSCFALVLCSPPPRYARLLLCHTSHCIVCRKINHCLPQGPSLNLVIRISLPRVTSHEPRMILHPSTHPLPDRGPRVTISRFYPPHLLQRFKNQIAPFKTTAKLVHKR